MAGRPDILVLGGGGRQGDAWMNGVLAGIGDGAGLDLRSCEYFVGTSAGSIVAARLSVGRSPRRPAATQAGDRAASAPVQTDAPQNGLPPLPRWALERAIGAAAPIASLGLRSGTRPRAAVRALALALLPQNGHESLEFEGAFPAQAARFDGRLRIAAVERASGRRVVFGAPGGPTATVAQALTASCSVPMIFPPTVIDGREYVDGAVWSPTNADAAPATRDAQVLILAPMASRHGPFSPPVRVASRALLLAEAAALRARGAQVRIVTPDSACAAAFGRDLMESSGLEQTLALGYAQGLGLAKRS